MYMYAGNCEVVRGNIPQMDLNAKPWPSLFTSIIYIEEIQRKGWECDLLNHVSYYKKH